MYELNLDFSALYKQIQTGSEKDQYLISERGLQVPSIIGCHEVQKYNQTLAPPSRAKINYNRMRPLNHKPIPHPGMRFKNSRTIIIGIPLDRKWRHNRGKIFAPNLLWSHFNTKTKLTKAKCQVLMTPVCSSVTILDQKILTMNSKSTDNKSRTNSEISSDNFMKETFHTDTGRSKLLMTPVRHKRINNDNTVSC